MKIGRLKRDFKLNYGIEILKSPPWRFVFDPYIKIWFFILHEFPDEGAQLQEGKHYRGLYWSWDLFSRWNIIFYSYTFKVPRILRRLIPYEYYRINFPIKIKHY